MAVLILWGLWQGYQVRTKVLAQADLQVHHRPAHPGKSRRDAPTTPSDTPSTPVIQRAFLSSHGDSPWGSTSTTRLTPQVIAVLSPGVLHETNLSIARARQYLRRGDILSGRSLLNRSLMMLRGFAEPQAKTIRHLLSRLNQRTLLSGGVIPDDPLTRVVPITSGQSLDYLAYLYRITPHLLRRINPGVNPRALRPGTGIKVILGPFDAKIMLRNRRLDVLDRGIFITSMPIRMANLLPVPPGRYRLQIGGEAQFVNPLGPGRGYRITLVKSRPFADAATSSSTVVLTTAPATVGEIEIPAQPMGRLFELLSPQFSRVEILP